MGRCLLPGLAGVFTAEELTPVAVLKIAPEIIILGYLDLRGTLRIMTLCLSR